jgi:hypothetical protein
MYIGKYIVRAFLLSMAAILVIVIFYFSQDKRTLDHQVKDLVTSDEEITSYADAQLDIDTLRRFT